MTAESISSFKSNDKVRKLQIVKAGEELSARAVPSALEGSTPKPAIPPVLDWGPSELWAGEEKPAVSASLSEQDAPRPDDN